MRLALALLLAPMLAAILAGCAQLEAYREYKQIIADPALPVVPPPPLMVIGSDGGFDATIDGRPVRGFASPGMPSAFYLSRGLARGLWGADADDFTAPEQGFAILSISVPTSARIGPVEIAGRHRSINFGLAPQTFIAGGRWFEADAYPFADLLAGPHALPSPVVRFELRPPQPGEVSFTVPMAHRNSWWLATTPQRFGSKTVQFAFAPQFADTVASAAAGAVMVRDLGGAFTGPARPTLISYGVERPARPVRLARPLRFGPIAIADILVRTADYGSAANIADAGPVDPSEDGGDLVVEGRRKGGAPAYVVYVGAAALAGCSSITYDKPAQTISLSCRG